MSINLEYPAYRNFLMCIKFVTPFHPKLPNVIICHDRLKPLVVSGITPLIMTSSEHLVYFCRIPIAWVHKCEQLLSKCAWQWVLLFVKTTQCKGVKPEGPQLFALFRQACKI